MTYDREGSQGGRQMNTNTALQWDDNYQTGGGCTAISAQLAGDTYCLITEVDDPSAPSDINGPCALGLYRVYDGEQVGSTVECRNVAQAKAIAEVWNYLADDDCDGAVLVWQAPDELAFALAVAKGAIKIDESHDLFVHPAAVSIGDGAYTIAKEAA